MIRFEGVSLAVAGRELVRGVDLHIRPGDRLGLVGRNGCGKTTLLGAITGRLEPEAGRIHRRSRLTVGELPQDAVSGSQRPLWQEARSGLGALLELEARLAEAVEALDGSPAAIAAHARAEEAFRAAGGYAMEERIGVVLHGLGFRREDWERPCTEFSGGWQMRIALARLLLSAPDVLLLDEPTNHLDLHSRSWLAGFLEGWRGAVLIVSHDRYVLDRATTAIAEIRGGRLSRYRGNFTSFLRLRALADAERAAAREKYEAERSRAEAAVARFGAKATRSRQVHARLARIERRDAPERAPVERRPRLRLKPPEAGAQELLVLHRVSAGWGGVPVLEGVDLAIGRGERWFVLGPNGCGKSTLLRVLAGELPPLSGRRSAAQRVRIGRYEQDQALALPRERSGLEHLLGEDPFCPEVRARAALGALGLSGEKALQPIGSLSGGEKARVALAGLAMKPWEVLLLDEPTNHLDAVTVDVLAEALEDWPGALVAVTHDRHLVERLATHVAVFRRGGVSIHEGLRPEDLEPRRGSAGPEVGGRAPGRAEDYRARKRRQRQRERAARRVAELEGQIEALESELGAIDERLAALAHDPGQVGAALAERAAVAEALDRAMADWERASEAAEAGGAAES